VSRNRTDEVPYDRELIRSGGVAATRGPAQEASPRQRRATQPGRRRRSPFRAIGILFLMLLVAAGVGIFLLGARAAAFNATVSTAPFPSTALLGAMNGTDRVNVLMIGYGGGDHDGPFLADSIQILSIDPETDTTTTIPIPRDLWIEGITEFSQNGKVNEVFAVGEAEAGLDAAGDRLAEVVSDVTGLEIHHWLSIDFAGFEEMVDAVGGVTVQNPVAFSYTSLAPKHLAGIWDLGTFEAGELHLDGAQALAYSRARYTSVVAESNDFARSIRQARVLAALRAKLGDGGIGSIGPGLQLMDAMEGRVRTDLSVIDLALLSGHLSSDRRIELSEGPVLTATTNTIGQYILIPTGWTGPGDYGGLQAYIGDPLAQPIPSASPSDGAAP